MERFPLKKRIVLYKVFSNKKRKPIDFLKNIRKYRVLVTIILVIVIILAYITKVINPVFLNLAQNKSYNIAVKLSNNAIHQKLKEVSYSDLVILEKDSNGKITMVSANTYAINQISNEISMIIQEQMENLDDAYIQMPLGLLFGSNILSNMGPKISIKILPIGAISTTFRSEFESSGINQTIHKIFVDVNCVISIVTPFETKRSNFVNSILVNEVVIVGEIPDTFYNFEGVKDFQGKDTMDLIE